MPENSYVDELKQTLAEARRVARQAELEKEVFQKQAAVFKAKVKELEGPPPAPTVRKLSQADYAKVKADAYRTLRQAERDRKESATLPDLAGVDVRTMSKEEYRALKNKLTRRG